MAKGLFSWLGFGRKKEEAEAVQSQAPDATQAVAESEATAAPAPVADVSLTEAPAVPHEVPLAIPDEGPLVVEEPASELEPVIVNEALIAAEKVNGTNVYNPKGDKLGSVEDIMIDKVSGKAMVKVVPTPGVDWIVTRPPRDWISRRTTSKPTPRPERADTTCFDEKPGKKRRLSISVGAKTAPGEINPFASAASRTRFRSIPPPSSATSIITRPDRWAADSVIRPVVGLPADWRSLGVSIP